MTNWRKSGVVAVVCICIFFAVQLIVPISRISDDARRFGWQMFSTAQRAPLFVVVTESGEVGVDLDDYMANVRADMDLEVLLPPHLCLVVPGAASVTWEEGTLEC